MMHALQHGYIPKHQHGSCRGRDATTVIMHQKTLIDITYQQNGQMAVISNDAKGCYDRIIAILAGIICKKIGMGIGPIFVLL